MSNYFRSLLITGILGLVLPWCAIAGFFIAFFLLGVVPAAHPFATAGCDQLTYILETFGNGNSLQGAFIIGGAISIVSTLFDACNSLILSKPIR